MNAVRLLALVYTGLIFWVSSQSGEKVGRFLPLPYLDLVAHALAYALMAVLWYAALRRSLRLGATAVAWITFAFVVLYGVSDEIHQSFVPGRKSSVLDVVADAVGAALGLAVMRLGPVARRSNLGTGRR